MSRRQENLILGAFLAIYPFLEVWLFTRELLWATVAYGLTLGISAVIDWPI